jgi:hypothetical protein
MLTVRCSFVNDTNPDKPLCGFDMGHMEFSGNLGSHGSSGRTPDQSMMILLSIVMLLDGLHDFVTRGMREFEFIGVDCSFRVLFHRNTGTKVTVVGGGRPIHEADISTLAPDVFDSVGEFARASVSLLPTNDAVRGDLLVSLRDFARWLGR